LIQSKKHVDLICSSHQPDSTAHIKKQAALPIKASALGVAGPIELNKKMDAKNTKMINVDTTYFFILFLLKDFICKSETIIYIFITGQRDKTLDL
jgi:hypothetical protein